MSNSIAIIDYGMGNLFSIHKKLLRLKMNPKIVSKPEDIKRADKVILPGVGHFQKAMENLKSLDLIEALNNFVMIQKKPILGICLGMQLLANYSEEGNAVGLKWIDAEVKRFNVSDTLKFKVPHTGWNQIINMKPSKISQGIPDGSEFYFVHSYFMKCNDKDDVLHATDYDGMFTSAIEKNNIFGVQYHPEKSHEDGDLLLKNFIAL